MTRARSDMSKPIIIHLEQMLRSVEGWDDDPPHVVALYLVDGRVQHGSDIIPVNLWTLDRPPQVLEAIANDSRQSAELNEILVQTMPDDWIGLAFMHEAWMVKVPEEGIPADLDRDSREHTIYRRPDRVEARIIYAETTYGAFLGIMERDGPLEVAKQENAEGVDSGTVPEALHTLFEVFVKNKPTRPQAHP